MARTDKLPQATTPQPQQTYNDGTRPSVNKQGGATYDSAARGNATPEQGAVFGAGARGERTSTPERSAVFDAGARGEQTSTPERGVFDAGARGERTTPQQPEAIYDGGSRPGGAMPTGGSLSPEKIPTPTIEQYAQNFGDEQRKAALNYAAPNTSGGGQTVDQAAQNIAQQAMNYAAPNTTSGGSDTPLPTQNITQYAQNYGSGANDSGKQFNVQAWLDAIDNGKDTGNGATGPAYGGLQNNDYDPGEGYDYTDWRRGNITTRPEGGYTVYDGKQNRMGHYDSAGNWHADISDTDLADSWAKVGQQWITDNNVKFTGDGQDIQYDMYPKIGPGYGPWTKRGKTLDELNAMSYEERMRYMAGINGIDDSEYNYISADDIRNGDSKLKDGVNVIEGLGGWYNYPDIGGGRSYPTGGSLDPWTIPSDFGTGVGTGYGDYAISGRTQVPEAPDLKPLLDEWRAKSEERQQGQIDYAVQQGVDELTHAQEDAQKGFRTAQEQISAEEAANKDNQALYAEARGDKGGIGAAQYDSVMNTAAINRQQVREQQTQLATDTARQIADLRAKGEFQKADAVLQISQEYLSNLMNLEQWAANYGLSAAQFEESMREWEENFKLSVANITGYLNGQQTLAARESDRNFLLNEAGVTGTYKGQQTRQALNDDRNFRLNEAGVTGYYNGRRTLAGENSDRNFNLSEAGVTGYYNGMPTYQSTSSQQSTLASAGNALLSAGIMPSDDQLRAMGLSSEQAQALLMAAQAKAASGRGGGGYSTAARDAYALLSDAGVTTEGQAYNELRKQGYKDGDAKTFAEYYMKDLEASQSGNGGGNGSGGGFLSGLLGQFGDWVSTQQGNAKVNEIKNLINTGSFDDVAAAYTAVHDQLTPAQQKQIEEALDAKYGTGWRG